MPRKNVGFVKPPEPSFITRMKQEVGYKEGPTVDTKREALATDEDLEDRGDDEAPTVVVLREGDLTAEQADRELAAASSGKETAKEECEEEGGRIMFRKPVKRDSSEGGVAAPRPRGAGKRSRPNTKLLSFQQDEDEDDA